jgi:hypothetical protein
MLPVIPPPIDGVEGLCMQLPQGLETGRSPPSLQDNSDENQEKGKQNRLDLPCDTLWVKNGVRRGQNIPVGSKVAMRTACAIYRGSRPLFSHYPYLERLKCARRSRCSEATMRTRKQNDLFLPLHPQ